MSSVSTTVTNDAFAVIGSSESFPSDSDNSNPKDMGQDLLFHEHSGAFENIPAPRRSQLHLLPATSD